jgi:hypothetical protein
MEYHPDQQQQWPEIGSFARGCVHKVFQQPARACDAFDAPFAALWPKPKPPKGFSTPTDAAGNCLLSALYAVSA